MAHVALFCLAAVFACLAGINGVPQFGDFANAQANAQAGGFGGGGFGRYPQGPGFGYRVPQGPPGYGNRGPGGFYRPGGFNQRPGGGSISFSKSISISRGGAGSSQSSASSSAGSFGK